MQKKRSKPLAGTPMLPAGNADLPSARPEELWVRPNYNLRQPGERSSGGNISPERGQRLLELADIALGVKKPAGGKKKTKILSAEAHHQKMVQQKRKRPPRTA